MTSHFGRSLAATFVVILLPVLGIVACAGDDDGPSSPGGGNGGSELNSGSIAAGAEFEHSFDDEDAFPYHCSIHPMMRATVVVDAASTAMRDTVSIVNSSSSGFQPASVTIAPGGVVLWRNLDGNRHTVTSD